MTPVGVEYPTLVMVNAEAMMDMLSLVVVAAPVPYPCLGRVQ